MNIFLSWSGQRSRSIARYLHTWIPSVLHKVEIWLSDEDLQKGSRFHKDIADHLEKANFGIICLTPENFRAPWINFEAGALSKQVEESRVFTLLFQLKPQQLEGSPLGQFQHTFYSKEELRKLLRNINDLSGDEKVSSAALDNAFRGAWQRLNRHVEKTLRESSGSNAVSTPRSLPDVKGLKRKKRLMRFTTDEQFERLCGEIDKQLNQFGIIAATGVARAILLQEQYELALKLFLYLYEKASPLDKELYIVYGSIGYCLTGMGCYEEACAYHEYVKTRYNETYFAWHAVELAYDYWKLKRYEEFTHELEYAQSKQEYLKEVSLYAKLYPEIKDKLK